jgi:starch-binding outer membrane protein, SusD/RagB family
MKYTKSFLALLTIAGLFVACRKELDVQNPNLPTPESASTETGILALGQGGVYISGFKGLDEKFNDGVPGFFWTGAVGFHDIMGDVVGAEAANWFMNQIGCPDEVVLDNNSVVTNPQNPNKQYELLRGVNDNSNGGQNPTFHEWANMYSLNNACNNILSIVEDVKFVQDADVKKKTIQAWAYWWKGFAYARIGSIYYAGLVNNEPNKASNVFVTKENIINESNANLDKAAALLGTLSGGGAYDKVMGSLVPDYIVTASGFPSPSEWVKNINTLKARNILVNTPLASISSAQWASIKTLTDNGIAKGDKVFVGLSNDNGDIWAPLGLMAGKVTGTPGSVTYKVSERFVQEFKTGDKRKENNFDQEPAPWIGNSDRGTIFNTRWALANNGNGLAGVVVLGSRDAGAISLYLAGSYEENELMKAEVKIYSGDVDGGLAIIDAIRNDQGAGLSATSNTGLSADAAKEELRRERRCALAFRGVAFYDARRWGVIEKGGPGRTGCVVVDAAGGINTNATIRYNFLDYWDVPANELAYNPAGAGSVPTENPKR